MNYVEPLFFNWCRFAFLDGQPESPPCFPCTLVAGICCSEL